MGHPIPQEHTERPLWKLLLLDIHWTNLFNPRMWIAAGWTGFLAAIVAAFVWEPLIVPAFFVVGGAVLLATTLTPARCPECRRRVKINATRCAHCGVEVQAGSAR